MNEGDRIIMFVDHLLNKFWIRIAKMTLIYECSKNGRKRFLMDTMGNFDRNTLGEMQITKISEEISIIGLLVKD